MAAVDLNLERYSEERGQAFYRELLDRLNAMRGVVSASLAFSVPPNRMARRSLYFPSGPGAFAGSTARP